MNRKYGCLMVVYGIEKYKWKRMVMSMIRPEDVYDDGTGDYGLELEPHVTALYGIHDDETTLDDVKACLPITSTMSALVTGTGFFECPNYDVVKFEIHSPAIVQLNSTLIGNLPYTNDYPDYVPHMTVAYVNKGSGSRYAESFAPIVIKPLIYKYGHADGNNTYFNIGKPKQ